MTKKRKTVAKIVELVARKKCILSRAVGPIDIKGSVGRHPFIRLTSIIINYLMETCAIMMNYGHWAMQKIAVICPHSIAQNHLLLYHINRII